MAIINIDITKPLHQRVIAATCARFNYQSMINDMPNPETSDQFTARVWMEQMKTVVMQVEQSQAQQNFIKNNPINQITL